MFSATPASFRLKQLGYGRQGPILAISGLGRQLAAVLGGDKHVQHLRQEDKTSSWVVDTTREDSWVPIGLPCMDSRGRESSCLALACILCSGACPAYRAVASTSTKRAATHCLSHCWTAMKHNQSSVAGCPWAATLCTPVPPHLSGRVKHLCVRGPGRPRAVCLHGMPVRLALLHCRQRLPAPSGPRVQAQPLPVLRRGPQHQRGLSPTPAQATGPRPPPVRAHSAGAVLSAVRHLGEPMPPPATAPYVPTLPGHQSCLQFCMHRLELLPLPRGCALAGMAGLQPCLRRPPG